MVEQKTNWSHLQDFAEYTSIHGILYIFKKSISRLNRLVWTLICLLCFGLCFYQSLLSVQEYLLFNVKTSTTFQQIQALEFPSITFCAQNIYKRSMVGNSSWTPLLLQLSFANNEKDEAIINPINAKTCKSNNDQSEYVKVLRNIGLEGIFKDPALYIRLMEQAATNYQSEVVTCWWEDVEIPCNSIIGNRLIDDTSCYTFNAGSIFIDIIQKYGLGTMNLSNYDESKYVINKNWMKNKIRFLLNTNQSEYCGTDVFKRGAGLFAMITEKDNTPLKMFSPPIYLSPGYVNNINMKPIFYNRQTEHLGKCTTSVDLFSFPGEKKYLQGICYFQCVIGILLRRCGCFPPNFIGFRDHFRSVSDKFGVMNSTIDVCNHDGFLCCRKVQQTQFFAKALDATCPECKRQCSEKTYGVGMTRSLTVLRELKQDLTRKTSAQHFNDSELQKNYFYVSFGFENNYAEVVVEQQAVTIMDVFIAFGNNIGLFLGMSFMSNFEIVLSLICQSFFVGLKKLFPACFSRKIMNTVAETDKTRRRVIDKLM